MHIKVTLLSAKNKKSCQCSFGAVLLVFSPKITVDPLSSPGATVRALLRRALESTSSLCNGTLAVLLLLLLPGKNSGGGGPNKIIVRPAVKAGATQCTAVPNRAETAAALFEHHETVANAKAAAEEL